MTTYRARDYVGQDEYYVGQDEYYGAGDYYDPNVGAWPWWTSVGQQGRMVVAQPYDPTKDSNWAGARGLVLSTIQAVLGDDATFNRVATQIIAHLRRQGFLNERAAMLVRRPDFFPKLRTYFRQMLYYMDTNAVIDLTARELFRVLASKAVPKPSFG